MFNRLTKAVILFLILNTNLVYAAKVTSIAISGSDADKCFEVTNTNIGSKLKSGSCSNSLSQKFLLDGSLIKPRNNTKSCLTVGSITAGAPVYLWSCQAAASSEAVKQKFVVEGNTLKLQANQDLCLGLQNDNNSIVITNCNDLLGQQVSMRFIIKTASGQCLHVADASNKTVLSSKKCNKSINQEFYYNGKQIKTALDLNKCLDSFILEKYLEDTGSFPGNSKIFLNLCDRNQANRHQNFLLTKSQISRFDLPELCFSVSSTSDPESSEQSVVVLNKCRSDAQNQVFNPGLLDDSQSQSVLETRSLEPL